MNFDFTEEQKIYRESIKKFLSKEVSKELLQKVEEEDKLPDDLWKKIGAMGLFGVSIPQEYGGSGADIIFLTMIIEELSKSITPVGFAYIMSTIFGAKSVEHFGNEEQKEFYLPKIADGKIKFSLASTEPDCGTDALAIRTSAALGGNSYIINGQKTFISLGTISDYIITVAKTDEKSGKRGFTLFIVDAKSPGIERRPIKKLGVKGSDIAEIFFSEVEVPKENILGELNRGFHHLVQIFNDERIAVSAMALGIGKAAFELAVNYAKEREAFGRPIGEFQAIQHYLAEMKTYIEGAEIMVYRAAWLRSIGKDTPVDCAIAKLIASKNSLEVCGLGMRIMGGWSITCEYDMQRHLRDSVLNTIGPVSNEMIRNIVGESLGLPRSY